MATEKNLFRHESLQNVKSIQDILKSITKGLAKGILSFSDEDSEINLAPKGLINLKVTARKEENYHRLDIRLSWQATDKEVKKKHLQVSHNQ